MPGYKKILAAVDDMKTFLFEICTNFIDKTKLTVL